MPVINFTGETKQERLAQVKTLLAKKFPTRHVSLEGILPTGLDAIDASEGGLHKASITEVVGSSGLFIEAMLSVLCREGCLAALIDANYSFNPEAANPAALPRLLWVICKDAKQAIKAADLLLRDANLPLVMLDLQLSPEKQLRGIPGSTWHRFQRLIEHSSTAFVVLSSQPIVEGARARVTLRNRWNLDAMRLRRSTLMDNLAPQVSIKNHTTTQEFYTSQ